MFNMPHKIMELLISAILLILLILVNRTKENRQELPAPMAELPPPGRPAREHHPRRAAPNPGAPLSMGQPVRDPAKKPLDHGIILACCSLASCSASCNRWSKIAQHLPGRTDNEIKNYWRTRVQKHAKQLQCDVNSKQFKDVMRYLWMPRLVERIQAASGSSPAAIYQNASVPMAGDQPAGSEAGQVKPSPETSSAAGSSSDSAGMQFSSPPIADCFAECYGGMQGGESKIGDGIQDAQIGGWWPESLPSPDGNSNLGLPDFDQGAWGENLWSLEDIWLQQQFYN